VKWTSFEVVAVDLHLEARSIDNISEVLVKQELGSDANMVVAGLAHPFVTTTCSYTMRQDYIFQDGVTESPTYVVIGALIAT